MICRNPPISLTYGAAACLMFYSGNRKCRAETAYRISAFQNFLQGGLPCADENLSKAP